jgi:hypothetical protein
VKEKQVTKHHEIDRYNQKRQMLARYTHLRFCTEFDLSIDEQLFLQNFEVAMQLIWVYREIDIPDLLRKIDEAPLN